MSMESTLKKLGARNIAAVASGALVLGALGFAAAAGAQPGPDGDKGAGDCPKAESQDSARYQRGPRMDEGRPAFRRDGQGDANREARQRPPRGEFGPGPDGNGPPRRGEFGQGRDGYGPPPQGEFGPGPDGNGPPPRGEFGPGRDGYGPPPQGGFGRGRDGGGPRQGEFGPGPDGGRRQARAEFAPGPDGDGPRRGEFGPGPDGDGPRRGEFGPGPNRGDRPDRPAPPAFGDFDADGDGSISEAEFQAFHEKRMANRPPRPQGPPPMDNVAPPAPPAVAPVAPPAPPAE